MTGQAAHRTPRPVPPAGPSTLPWFLLPRLPMTAPDPTLPPSTDAALITVRINGDCRQVPAGLHLETLLEWLGYRPRLVVVEFNGEILRRDGWSEQRVVESDALEVVTIVGGGS